MESNKKVVYIKDGKSYSTKEWCQKLNERHYKFPYKRTYSKIKSSCKKRNIELKLTYEELVEFTKQKNCHYCGVGVTWVKHGKVNRYNLDRKDNKKSYSKENCVVCCWTCNNSKGNRYSYGEWYQMTSFLRKINWVKRERLWYLCDRD